jgi:hypothetical protein
LVRPVREQLEHDRLIRHLQLKYKKKHDVAINVGEERLAPVKIGDALMFPDLVLTDGKKVAGVVEVESAESVNNLEAMAQWVPFSRARVPFHLYVPVQVYDAARRLCEANGVKAAEVWSYRPLTEGFDLVRMSHDPSGGPRTETVRGVEKPAAKPAARPVAKPAVAVAKPAAPKPAPAKAAKKPAPKRAAKPARKPASRGKAKKAGKR